MYATKTYIGLVTLLLTCNNLVTNEWLPSCNYIYLYCLSTLRFFLINFIWKTCPEKL